MYKALLKESYIKRYSETVAVKTLKGARGHSMTVHHLDMAMHDSIIFTQGFLSKNWFVIC